jgi:hypothetical protein
MDEPPRTHVCVDGGGGHCSHCGGSTIEFYEGPTVGLCQWTTGCTGIAYPKIYDEKTDGYVPACSRCAKALRGEGGK